MKQIPNLFTLLNLLFGCLAIVAILQPGLVPYTDTLNNQQFVTIPEQIYLGSIFIGCAAVIDFLDGFVARFLKATSDIGKQLDSLADIVSFGIAPAFIVYQFLRLSYAQENNALDTSIWWLLPAFLIPFSGAYRLARFNIDNSANTVFKGVPIPAVGLLIGSFPLIFWITYEQQTWVGPILLNKWFWYALIFLVSWLMVSTLPMMALKFTNINIKKLLPFIILIIIAAISAFIVGWIAVPVTFIAYVILSLLYKQHTT